MSKLYHELLGYSDQALAILQEEGFLLLECNDKFAALCAQAPFAGGSLESFGFGPSLHTMIAEQVDFLTSTKERTETRWTSHTLQSAPSIKIRARVKFYEPETGHLIIAVERE